MAPMTLYFLRPSPPCRAVLLAIKTLGLDVKIENIDFFAKKEHLEPSFLKMNPAHTVPTLDDNGFQLWESRAILCYLSSKYGKDDKLYPKDLKKRAEVDKMMFWDATSLYSSLGNYFSNFMHNKEPTDEQMAKLKANVAILDTILANSPYAAGQNLTIADMTILISITTLDGLDIDYSEYANVYRWVQKLKSELVHFKDAVQPGLDDFKQFFDSKKAEARKK